MQYIPSFLCQIIDALAFRGDATQWKVDWETWKAEFEEFFVGESDYALSAEDLLRVQNLPSLLSQLEASVNRAFAATGTPEDLVKDTIDFFENHDSFWSEREKQYFVPNPSLDRLIKVCVSCVQGLAEPEAVLKRVPDAALAVNSIHELYLDVRESLPPELIEGFVKGFESAQAAFDTLHADGQEFSREILERVIVDLKNAGELLAHLVELFRNFEGDFGSPVPILGPLFDALRDEGNEDEEAHLAILREQAWPAFVEFWEGRQDGWLLDPECAYELLDELEASLAQFSQLLEVYPEEEEAFWEVSELLEELFVSVEENTLELRELETSPYWPEAQLLLNLLRGGAPLHAAHTMLSGIDQENNEIPQVIRDVALKLTEYIAEREPLPLLQGLQSLLQDFELRKTSRACQSCNEPIPLEAQSCLSCGAKVEKLNVSG